jgi:hypothetical protein
MKEDLISQFPLELGPEAYLYREKSKAETNLITELTDGVEGWYFIQRRWIPYRWSGQSNSWQLIDPNTEHSFTLGHPHQELEMYTAGAPCS